MSMLIGELAQALEITPKTLRHYEKVGLLAEPGRSAKGYRTYSESAVERARLIVGLRRLDLSLETILELMENVDGERSLRQRLMGCLDEKIQDYELRISVLQGKRDDLQARYDGLLSTPSTQKGSCICGALLRPCTCQGK